MQTAGTSLQVIGALVAAAGILYAWNRASALTAGVAAAALAFAPLAAADVPGIGPFVGNWGAHEEGLTINADGSGRETYNDRSSCPDAPMSGCGVTGTVDLRLTSASGDIATGNIIAASNPKTPVGGTVKVQLVETGPAPGAGLQLWVQGGDGGFPFCKIGPDGNRINQYYCGA